jgi:UDPglucose 6-dehydrogenase
MADLTEALGADIRVVSQALRLDERIGPRAYLDAGLGFGGSCLPKDLRTIIHTGATWGVTLQLARAVYAVNEERVARLEGRLRNAIGDLTGVRIAVWGLAFKGGTDDVRDSPATRFVQRLARQGADVRAYDPLANERAIALVGADVLCDDMYGAVAGAEALVIVTDCSEFAEFDFAAVHSAMRRPLIIDGRNALAAGTARSHGFEYRGVGTPEGDER